MATLIQQLAVELGLDPKKFKTGLEAARKDTKETENVVSKSANAMVSSLSRVAAEFVSLFLVVRSVHDIVDFFADINESTRQLGFNAKNLGQSAADLRNWGNIAEIMGGQTEDATKTVEGLQQAVFSAFSGGGWDQRLTQFARLGVQVFDPATHQLRNFHDIILETSRALQDSSKNLGLNKAEFAKTLGLQGGLVNLVVKGPEAVEQEWRAQLKLLQVRQRDIDAAQELARSWDLLKQKMVAIATQVMTAVAPAIERLFNAFGAFVGKHQGDIVSGIEKLAAWAQGPGPGKIVDALTAVGEAAINMAHFINRIFGEPDTSTPEGRAQAAAQGGHKGPLGFLGSLTAVTSDISKTSDLDKNMLERKYNLPHGILDKVPAGISAEEAANALSTLHGRMGSSDADYSKTLEEYRRRSAFTDPATGAIGAKGQAAGAPLASNTGRGVSVQIDSMTVNTQATDADGIARDMSASLTRKLNVSLADGALA